MPTLDVSDIPLCVEFADRFDIIRRPETLSQSGRSVTSQVTVPGLLGTIYPTGDQSLVRQADYQTGRRTITVVTNYRLQQEAPGYQPDLVLYRGNQFLVREIKDFSQYGQGFIEAECSSIIAIDAPPQ
jgi:galactose-6-phosphate isomerase